MQDNWKNGLDPGFVDEAWDNMRMRLDEAMPVASGKKRRMIPWWWAAGLLLPLSCFVWIFLQNESPHLDAFPIFGKEKKAVAQTESSQTQAPAQVQAPPGTTTALTQISDQKSSPSIQTEVSRTTITKIEKEESPLEVQKITPSHLKTEKTNTIIIEEEKQIPERSLLDQVNGLGGLAIKELPTGIPSLELEPKPQRIASHWRLELGGSTRGFNDLDGFFAGVGYQFGKGYSRWSLGTGLFYRFQRLPFDPQNIVKENAGDPNSGFSPVQDTEEALGISFDNSGFAYFQSIDSVISIPISELYLVQKLHFIELPIYLNYKLSPKFQLHSSIQISYLWKAFLDLNQRSFNHSNLDYFTSGSLQNRFSSGIKWYSNSSNARLGQNKEDFHQFQLGAALGLTYFPTHQLGLRFQFKSSFGNVYKHPDLVAQDYWLGTSLIWRFGSN